MEGTPIFAAGTLAALAAAQSQATVRAMHHAGEFSLTTEIAGISGNGDRHITIDRDETMDIIDDSFQGTPVTTPIYRPRHSVTMLLTGPLLVDDPAADGVSISLQNIVMSYGQGPTGIDRHMTMDLIMTDGTGRTAAGVRGNQSGGALWLSEGAPLQLDTGDAIQWTLQDDVVFTFSGSPITLDGAQALTGEDTWTLHAGSTMTTTVLLPAPATLGVLAGFGLASARRRRS